MKQLVPPPHDSRPCPPLATVPTGRWQPVSALQMGVFSVALLLFLLVLWQSERGFIPVLDHANLLFHEAGHFFVGLLSQRLEIYGGTLGQLVFPALLAIQFFRQGHTIAFATALLWFFQNWLNIARYVADARTLALPLVGGGLHDWNTILNRWNCLEADTRLALIIEIGAALGMISIVLWLIAQASKAPSSARSTP